MNNQTDETYCIKRLIHCYYTHAKYRHWIEISSDRINFSPQRELLHFNYITKYPCIFCHLGN